MNFEPVHVVIEILGTAVALWGILYQSRRQDRKEREEQETIQTKRHQANQNAMQEISTNLSERPPHVHIEREGVLTAKGLRYGPKNGSKL